MTPRQTSLLFLVLLCSGIAALYAIGLNHQLVFDDARLTDGTIFGQYGSLLQLKERLLSYGSFVWIQDLFGGGWAKQRAFNVVLHMATAASLYALTLELLSRTEWAESHMPDFSASMRNAARAGIALWALNPVAVYAVAYLVQRSILMATLFVVLAALSFTRGLATNRKVWMVLALISYFLAVASKSHAIGAVLVAVPLFVFVKRPPVQRVLVFGAASVALLAVLAALLYARYGDIVGSVFDETSRAFALQLEQQRAGVSQHLYPLSIINQASLYFQYGLLWLVPFVGWMSIDLRPAFPLTMMSWQLAAALAWVAMLCGSVWLVSRRRDAWSLLGLCALMPALLFITEFSTVWLQDPFVLYRSYLWSISIPVLLAIPLVGHSGRHLYAVVLIVAGVLAASSYERIHSLQTPTTAWEDASQKVDINAPANAVGRWRPFLNMGVEAQERGDSEAALRLFGQAEALGEPMGSARLNMGVSLQQLNKHEQALENFAAAEVKGFAEAALHYQRGESLFALRRFAEAYASFTKALTHPQVPEAEDFTRLRQAEAALSDQKFDDAIASYQRLIQKDPAKQRYKVGISMALTGKKDYQGALDNLNGMIAQRPTGPAFYARALTYFYQGNTAASVADIDNAIRAEPNNPVYRSLQQKLSQLPEKPVHKSTAKPAPKP